SAFNQDISSWNVSAVTDMGNMFVNNVAFNQNIASWNVSSVSTFSNMFSGASAFNQPIGNWTTTNLTSTSQMFYNASSFDQNLGSWDVSKVTSMSNMFSNSGLSGSNYDNILIGWAAQTVQSGVALGAIGVTYCTGETGRNTLTGTYSWSISGDSKNCPPTNILLDATTINERNSINDLVATLSSTDDVGDTHTYDLVTGFGSLDNASFSVSGNQLLANTVFDFETKTIYAIRIRSTDNKGNWFEKGLFININDITGLSQSITFNTLTPVTYGDAGFSLTATASSGLGVSYISSDETVATVSGSNVTIVGPGTTTITASQAGDGDFAAATPVDQALTVNKASQTITFNTLADKIYGEVAFDLTGTASSTLGVSFVSSDPLVATISGNTVTIVGAGTTTITASQTGDANYNAATDVPHTLTVNKAVLTATADDKIITYGDVIPALTFTYSGFVNGEDATALTAEPIAGTTATGSSDAGTYNITLTGGTADNYSFLLVNGTLTISKADQIISITPIANKVVTDGSFDVTASTTSTLPLTYSIQSGPATITGNTITLDGTTGTVVVEVTQAGNTSFNAAAQTVSFTVTDPSKTDQTITFAALATKTYGDADFDLTAAASSGLAVSYTSSNTAVATVSGSTVTIIGAGTTEITAAQTGNATFNPAADAVQPLTVNKADQTISVDPIADKQPGTTPFDVITTVSSGLNIVYSITGPATISGATITLDGTLGVVTLTASQPGNNNYNAATDVQVSFNVSSTALLDQTITLDPVADKATTEGPFEIVASASSGLAVSLSVTGPATVTGTTVTLNGTAGTVTVTASQAGDTNYSPATAETSFQVIEYRVAQTITFGAIDNQLMEEGSLTLSGSASSALPVVYEIVSGPATVAGNVITFTALGTVVVRASQPGDNAFFPADPIEQTFDIITITGVDPARLSEVTFYPNPVVDQITLQTSTLKVVQVNLLNLSGQIAFSTRKDFEHLNVGHLKTGHYILQIVTDKEVITKKLIKN
ncbi:MAG: BspA family leucine-rich repeat surface protein, partial [Cyclobacteriaceae bacterium]|nr:BspA family leucine-rich repeat surface protein [Cyclobacteriaceae bacterium]